jgi:asparagine synthase (glutamine-hydrolysing)
LTAVPTFVGPADASALDRTARALSNAVGAAVDGTDAIEVLFSGGLDSSLIAHLARQHVPVRLVTVGLPGSADLAAARAAALRLGLEWRGVECSEGDVESVARRWVPPSDGLSPTGRAVRVAFALALTSARAARVLTGQGADELFFGYAHFRPLTREWAVHRQADDLDRFLGQEWPFALDAAADLHVDLRAPFLDAHVVHAALALAPPELGKGEAPKARLREIAVALGLPPELAATPKRALQYGSGVDRFLRRRGTA